MIRKSISLIIAAWMVFYITSCKEKSKISSVEADNKTIATKSSNPVVYFEIPVTNIDRAMKFYTSVFNVTFETQVIDNNEMALFPFSEDSMGISGALARGEIYKPTKDGVVIYFKTEDIDKTLKLATENGGQILFPKASNGNLGFVAEFEDSEGNRIALFQSVK